MSHSHSMIHQQRHSAYYRQNKLMCGMCRTREENESEIAVGLSTNAFVLSINRKICNGTLLG